MAEQNIITGLPITEATVPDVTDKFIETLKVATMTPLGNPHDDKCVWGLPTIYWGASGIAKTARINQVAESYGMELEAIFPGQKQPEDFSGFFVPDGNGNVRMECSLVGLRRLNEKGRGILFIDEASCATPATQGAMLGMVNDRIVADTKFSPGIRPILAANPPNLSAGGWSLEAPMANRMVHFQVRSPSPTEWIDWMTTEGVEEDLSAKNAEETIRKNWAGSYSHSKGLFVGFMNSRQNALHEQPLPTNPQAGYCWPSPRTWWMAARAKATVNALGIDDDISSLFVEGAVGEARTQEFLHWVNEADLPTPQEALDNNWDPDPNRLDITMAVTTSCTSYVTNIRDKDEKLEMAFKTWGLLDRLNKTGIADVCLPAARALVRAKVASRGHKHAGLQSRSKAVLLEMADTGLLQYVSD